MLGRLQSRGMGSSAWLASGPVFRHVADPPPARAAPGPSSDHAINDEAYRNMSPAAREVFKEASENIMKLNASRMRALAELRAANEKIKELEARLQEAATQLGKQPAAQAPPAAQPQPTTDAAPTVPATVAESKPPSAPTVLLLYETGWDTAHIHYAADGKDWTKLPGAKLQQGSGEHVGKKVITLENSRLEFVMTDGAGKFDTPNPYGDANKPANYVIDSPGIWHLKSGRLTRVR